MRKILLVSHSTLAEGMHGFISMIMGLNENILFYNAYEESDTFESDIDSILDDNKSSELIVVSDLLGGSVNNYLLNKMDQIHLVTGMNPLLVLYLAINLNNDQNVTEIIKKAIEEGRKGIVYCNELFLQDQGSDDF